MIAFLFTDIEGSTVRWEAHPDAMPDAVRRHDELLRAAMEAHGGHIFKSMGDAFCVSFQHVRSAVDAAVHSQRVMLSHDWSGVDGLRVRMAIHAGQTQEREGDYFGNAVNRVARLLSAGHGGQILVSASAADLLERPTPDGVNLRSLGAFRLKDLRSPEHIFQVIAPGLPADFIPLRTTEAVPNNLPRPSSGFVGRADDIARIRHALSQSTLVTICGAGGVGKTRTALACATQLIDDMDDGAWFVNLAPLSDPALVASTIARALRINPADKDPIEALVEFLTQRRLLLVVDNCEHLIDQVARVLAAIHERCPQVTVIATSRESLHVDGEVVYRLPPLRAQDAVRLFIERARTVVPQFRVDDDELPLVEEICRHLDGVPLAIELAAARIRVLSLRELLRRIGERFRILAGGSRAALPRQQTLQALIDWSYDLLGDGEKTVFRRAAVFTGGFNLQSAAAVCAQTTLDEWQVINLIESLLDKSLLAYEGTGEDRRWYMLESIREYARAKLAQAGEADALAERHGQYFAGAAEDLYRQWDRHPSPSTLVYAVPDLDNFRSALRWTLERAGHTNTGARIAGGTGPLFMHLSLLSEGLAWGARAIGTADELSPELAGRLHYVMSMLYNNGAQYTQALSAAKNAVLHYRKSMDNRGTIRALSQLAQQYARAGRYADARPSADEAMERARKTGDARLFAGVVRRCAFSLPPAEIEQAREQFESAVEILTSLNAGEEACQLLEWWAEAEAAAGCFERAMEIGARALNCSDEAGHMHRTSNLAGYALAAGDFERAAPYTREALARAVSAKHALLTAVAIAYLAPIRASDDPQDAARLFGYGRAQMVAMHWTGIASDERARENILRDLRARLGEDALRGLLDEGAAWSETQALAHALASTSVSPSPGVQVT